MNIPTPYLIFLGDVNDPGYAKTAFGLTQWCPDRCKGQLRFPNCPLDLKLPDMTIEQAAALGVRTLVIGAAPAGGTLQKSWLNTLIKAAKSGMSIASGLHTKLTGIPELTAVAKLHKVELFDVRVPPASLPIATGRKRKGMRLLTIGTDCAVGKKYTALKIYASLKNHGVPATFRPTGQTGIMIAGNGIPIDSVISDFTSGAAEILSPDNSINHWDIIEGQGSLFHPAYSGVSLGLLHGSQPDALVLCHNPARDHLLGWPDYAIPDIKSCIIQTETISSLTNPKVKCIGICVNTSELSPEKRSKIIQQISQYTGLPCTDPIAIGVEPIIQSLFHNYNITISKEPLIEDL